MHQIAFGGRAPPGPDGELTAIPIPPSWISLRGPASKGRPGIGREWKEWIKEERKRNVGTGDGKGREKGGRVRRREDRGALYGSYRCAPGLRCFGFPLC